MLDSNMVLLNRKELEDLEESQQGEQQEQLQEEKTKELLKEFIDFMALYHDFTTPKTIDLEDFKDIYDFIDGVNYDLKKVNDNG